MLQQEMNQTAYSDQPVILMVYASNPDASQVIKTRLSHYFGVSADQISCSESGGISCFYFSGTYLTDFTPQVYIDRSSFTATASPVFGIKRDCASSLRDFAHDVRLRDNAVVPPQPPLALFHADLDNCSIWAVNDSFGIGRMYVLDTSSVKGVSNNVAALALASGDPVEGDDEFWSAYYTIGGGIGASTYIRGIQRASGGSSVSISAGRAVTRPTHAIEDLLLGARDRQPDYAGAVASAVELVEDARPLFNEDLSVGLSGGRDSRLVTAIALNAGLDFRSYTAVPPDLEGDIAAQLHDASKLKFDWTKLDRRVDAPISKTTATAKDVLPPILDRAENWFEFSGGDNWSTYVRRRHRVRKPIRLKRMSLSGAFGDYLRGHYYTERDVAEGASEEAVDRFSGALMKTRRILPEPIRRRGTELLRESLYEMRARGFGGFRALDLSFIINRMRRQFPHPAPNTLTPLLTTRMATETFWGCAEDRLNVTAMRSMTESLMPEWGGVPYFHEAAVGTDPGITNKVTIQPTYWEVDESDFLESVEHAIQYNGWFDLGMDRVEKEIRNLPEGRNRTNTTFEFMFWHFGASSVIDRINRVVAEFPV